MKQILSLDTSPCDMGFQAMQEEAAAVRLAQNEGASSADSASSGYMSPHFLRPPSPDDLHMQPRRSSDSGVDMPGHEVSFYYFECPLLIDFGKERERKEG